MRNTFKSTVCAVSMVMLAGSAFAAESGNLVLTPNAIPGVPRATNNNTSGGYAPSNVQAQLKIDVKEGTKEVKVIRDTTDPYVITKPYNIVNADPYAVRSYLEAAVGAKSVNSSPAQVTAVKFSNGKGVVLVSAEEYRFKDSEAGKGIDSIVKILDRKGLTYLPDADAHIYFPRISRASNLRDMLIKVGSSELDPQFAVNPGTILVDGELNALIVKAPAWNWANMLEMLKSYDRQIPEIKISYRVLEIYAENDDRIGVDFQSWKNNDGVDLFSAGTINRRNWGTFFTSGVHDNNSNRTSYWNFNPKWNSRYLDFMTSIGKAKCLTQGIIVAQNRKVSNIQVNTGFFYDRTYYKAGATSIAEGTTEFVYTDPNPDTIVREAITKIMPYEKLVSGYQEMGVNANIVPAGYTMRMMGTQTTTNTYADASAKTAYLAGIATPTAAPTTMTVNPQTGTLVVDHTQPVPVTYLYTPAATVEAQANQATADITKYLTGYVKADGTVVSGAYYNTNWDNANAAPGIIHGWLQYPMVANGFKFDLKVTPVITGKVAKVRFDMSGTSLLGWNSDGSPRMSPSNTSTTVQIGYDSQDFVIGGLRKSESVRGTTGLPFFKDLPVIGRLFSTETESIKQSQLVLIAKVEYSNSDSYAGAKIQEDLGKIVKGVNKGMNSRVGNMFFQQYGLDSDRADRNDRLDNISKVINDEYQELK